ncbi:hypothetical protein C8Q75DRAFT_385552 [Abortiporus biennis]|nr:hypothetical protein C8Q75DRAFT_385552 [Abortiporus biennis]
MFIQAGLEFGGFSFFRGLLVSGFSSSLVSRFLHFFIRFIYFLGESCRVSFSCSYRSLRQRFEVKQPERIGGLIFGLLLFFQCVTQRLIIIHPPVVVSSSSC